MRQITILKSSSLRYSDGFGNRKLNLNASHETGGGDKPYLISVVKKIMYIVHVHKCHKIVYKSNATSSFHFLFSDFDGII